MSGIIFLLVVLAAGFIILMVVNGSQLKAKGGGERTKPSGSLNREFIEQKWATIESMSAGTGSNLRDAVSEADKLLDYALKHSGIPGETMGERLKNSSKRFSDIDAIWSAHKVRNALAHEADFDLVPSQAREAVSQFRQGLRDLGAL